MSKTLLSIKSFCKYAGVGLSKGRELVNQGIGIYTVYQGKRKFVCVELYEQYLDSQIKQMRKED